MKLHEIEHEKRYTVKQAAELLGVHPRTIYRWALEDDLPRVRVGLRKTYIRGSDLLERVTRVKKPKG
jgi:excisionase family DNA binding protein